MTSHHAQPELFDLGQLERDALAATPWTGSAPLGYTTGYFDPVDLRAAFDRYVAEYGRFGCRTVSHMWVDHITDHGFTFGDHEMVLMDVDGGRECPPGHDHGADPLPRKLMYQAICAPCRWHEIGEVSNAVIDAWHDHAMPGWRDLPVFPLALSRAETRQQKAAAMAWITKNYPAEWQQPGVPVRTTREPNGTRHVSGRSPLGGYDLAINWRIDEPPPVAVESVVPPVGVRSAHQPVGAVLPRPSAPVP